MPNLSWHRPAARGPQPRQSIPRVIIQTGRSDAWVRYERFMQPWLELNPEYRYRFYDDERAARFVRQHGTRNEQVAYRALVTGAQKADLFRLLVLKYDGGVYADVDSELRAPLRTVIPAEASAVVGRYWTSEFMAYEPGHPLVVEAARRVTLGVLQQLRWFQQLALNGTDHEKRCRTPHSCVLMVTGPPVYMDSVSSLAKRLGCATRGRLPAGRECADARDESLRRVHICARDTGNVYRTWACNVSYHWDCRNSGARRGCSKSHYSKARNFFNLSALFGTSAAPSHPLRACQNERVCWPPVKDARGRWAPAKRNPYG